MWKIVIALTGLAILMATGSTAAPVQRYNTAVFTMGSRDCVVNGQKYSMNVAPVVVNARALIPISYIAVGMGIPGKDIHYLSQSRMAGYNQDQEIDITQSIKRGSSQYSQTTIILYDCGKLQNAMLTTTGSLAVGGYVYRGKLQPIAVGYAVSPVIINHTLMMPVRAIGEQMGAELEWNPQTRRITITSPR